MNRILKFIIISITAFVVTTLLISFIFMINPLPVFYSNSIEYIIIRILSIAAAIGAFCAQFMF